MDDNIIKADAADINDKSIEWLSCSGIDFNPYNLSVPDCLEKYGYAVVLNSPGSRLIEKAELCIKDVLIKNNHLPNIIIFCPAHVVQNWYSSLLFDIGAEFKYFNVNEKSISFFSESIENLYIFNSDMLETAETYKTVQSIRESGIVWDLMIIDMPFSTESTDVDIYIKNLMSKTNKLLINAPVPSKYSENCNSLLNLVKHLLYHKEQAAAADNYPVNTNIVSFNSDYPVMKDGFDSDDYNISTLYYTIDDNIIHDSKRIEDALGFNTYINGGNIFEEYSLDERKIYLRDEYSPKQLEQLKQVDKKLDVFIKELLKTMENPSNTVVVYTVCESTLNYLYKAIQTLYPENPSAAEIVRNNITDSAHLLNMLNCKQTDVPRILLANDNNGFRFNNIKEITHIFNYEYPDNPAVLQQRYSRRGYNANIAPVFYVFADTHYRFDGRILRKILLSNIHLAYYKQVPSRNIVFHIEDIEKHLTALLMDLKYICDYTGEVGSSFDVVSRFRVEYNIRSEDNVSNPAKAHELTGKRLKILSRMLDIEDFMFSKIVSEAELSDIITEKVSSCRSSFAYFDDDNKLCYIPEIDNTKLSEYTEHLNENRFVYGTRQAEGFMEKLIGENKDYVFLHNLFKNLNDTAKMSALLSCWKFYKEKRHIEKPFSEFIRLYNRGMI